MKKVLALVKANLVSVICIAVILIVFPAGVVASSIWGGGIRESRQTEAAKALSDIQGVKEVNYVVAVPIEGAANISKREAPNPNRTAAYAEIKAEVEQQAERVVERVVAFNRDGLTPLIEGLFPAPSTPLIGQRLALEFIDRLVGETGSGGAYAALLEEINAGPPADNERVRQQLQDYYDSQRERHQELTGRTSMNDEELEALRADLADRRLGAYRRAAQRVSMFATVDNLLEAPRRSAPTSGGRGRGGAAPPSGGAPDLRNTASRPEPNPDTPPSVAASFQAQHDYWVVREVLQAIDATNRDPSGARTRVPESPVKRLIALRVEQLFELRDTERSGARGGADDGFGGDSGGMDEGGGAGPLGPPSASIYPSDPSVSITGRAGSKGNELYDLRRVEVEMIVASARIEDIIRAIEASNLISVLDLSIASVDPAAHLAEGYDYGGDHVVRLTLKLETLWLRLWTVPFMPDSVRSVLGVPAESASDGGDAFE